MPAMLETPGSARSTEVRPAAAPPDAPDSPGRAPNPGRHTVTADIQAARTVVLDSTDEPPYKTLYRVLGPGRDDAHGFAGSVQISLTDQQARDAADALRLYRERTAAALDTAEDRDAARTAALGLYRQATAWLDDAYIQARYDAHAERERAEHGKHTREGAAGADDLRTQDAVLGPRIYVRGRIPASWLTRAQQRRYADNAPETWQLHLTTCVWIGGRVGGSPQLHQDPATAHPGGASRLRAAAALQLLMGGAYACQACRPAEQLAQDLLLTAPERERAAAEQNRSDERIMSLLPKALHYALGNRRSPAPGKAGYGVVVQARNGSAASYLVGRIELREGESLLGYRDGDRRGWRPVAPGERAFLDEMARGRGWHARWCEDPEHPGNGYAYFAVRHRTRAEARAAAGAEHA